MFDVKNMEEDTSQPFNRVSTLLLPQEACRDLMNFLLLRLWSADHLPATLHCISSHALTQVGVVQEMGIMSCGSPANAMCQHCLYSLENPREAGSPLVFSWIPSTCPGKFNLQQRFTQKLFFPSRVNLALQQTACWRQNTWWEQNTDTSVLLTVWIFPLGRRRFLKIHGEQEW